MADLENFESTGEPNVEEDPAAEFLAREQNELAGLEDDNFAVEESSQPPEVAPADNGFNAFEESTAISDAPAEEVPQVSVETDLINPEPVAVTQPSPPPQPSPTSFIDTFETEEPPQEPPQVSVETDLISPEPVAEPQPSLPSVIDTIATEEPSLPLQATPPSVIDTKEPPQEPSPPSQPTPPSVIQTEEPPQEPTPPSVIDTVGIEEPPQETSPPAQPTPPSVIDTIGIEEPSPPPQPTPPSVIGTIGIEEPSPPPQPTPPSVIDTIGTPEPPQKPSPPPQPTPPSVIDTIGIEEPPQEPSPPPQPTLPSVIDTIGIEEPPRKPPQTNGPTDGGGYAAIAQADKHRQEPEKIRMWREDQKKRLELKDADEEVKNSQWRDAAKKELEDWLKHHAEQLVKTKENNRAAAAAELAEITCGNSSDMGSDEAQEEASNKEREETIAGQEWEKICRLCDFNPKHSKNTKDVSRMRSILLQLKQTPLVR